MAIINQRWPRDLCPETCTFSRTRNDVRQISPRTRQSKNIRMGRPLWMAEVSWTFANDFKLAKLRYLLENLEGYAGSVQLWDFASPYPWGINASIGGGDRRLFWSYLTTRAPFSYAGAPYHWNYAGPYPLVATAAAIGATSIALKSLDPSKIVALQGQYIQIGRRIYIASANVTSDGSGNATLTFFPGLLAAAAVDAEVRLVEAACEMELADQNFKASARAGSGLNTVSATFVETVTDKS